MHTHSYVIYWYAIGLPNLEKCQCLVLSKDKDKNAPFILLLRESTKITYFKAQSFVYSKGITQNTGSFFLIFDSHFSFITLFEYKHTFLFFFLLLWWKVFQDSILLELTILFSRSNDNIIMMIWYKKLFHLWLSFHSYH